MGNNVTHGMAGAEVDQLTITWTPQKHEVDKWQEGRVEEGRA